MTKLSQWLSVSGRIVIRLRLVFLCIVLTLILVGIIGGYQLTYLVKSQESAIERAVPSLVTAHELQSKLASMLELRDRLRQTASVTVLIDLENRIKVLIRSLLLTVDQNKRVSTSAAPSTGIGTGLAALDQLLSDSLPLRLRLIRGQNRLSEQRQMLLELRTRFHNRVEPRVIEAAFLLGDALDQPEVLSAPARDLIRKQVDVQKSLSELSFRVVAVIDLAEQMSLRIGSNVSTEGVADLQFRLRSVAQILASLQNDAFRRQLALVLKELHDIILGEKGLIGELETLEGLETSLDSLLSDQSAVVKSVSLSVDNLVASARSDIAASSQAFSHALFQTLALLLLAGVLLTLFIAWVSYHVVERQIGRRMTRLTDAVLDIAGGDTKRVVAIKGHDEIGMMANALEVFKDNARKLHDTSVEMEQFVYAAAHDLRSPLRVIETLAQWTIEDGDDLPEDCLDNIKKILQRARRLSTLQSDLLNYSRTGQTKDSLEMVDLAKMVNELSDLLDPESCFSIKPVGQMPVVCTYATPLRQVLLNLLTNAIKHHDGDHGQIEVRMQLSGERMNLSVQDDGAGIEPRFQTQIFELFNTLHSKDEVEGSGLGLALILKLVSRYGGQVQVASNPAMARGATFSFDWPVQIAGQGPSADSDSQGGWRAPGSGVPSASWQTASRQPDRLPDEKGEDGSEDVSWRNAS